MASPNGTGASRRLRVSYDTITYSVEMPDGETVALAGYKRGAGCPISVEIDVEGVWAEYSEDTPTEDERNTLTSHRYLAKAMRAERLMRRGLLCAVIPGLEQQAADIFATDNGPWESILVELGWFQPRGATTEGPTTEGEAEAADPPSTGSAALPESSAPTTGSRSRTSRP